MVFAFLTTLNKPYWVRHFEFRIVDFSIENYIIENLYSMSFMKIEWYLYF